VIDDLEKIFQAGWGGSDSLSGPGSDTKRTDKIARAIYLVQSMLRAETGRGTLRINDVGCGDVHWARHMFSAYEYHGFDVCSWPTWPELQEDGWDLRKADVIRECLPDTDLTVCRDVMIHLTNKMNCDLLDNVELSSRWLLATTFVSGATGRPFTNADREKMTRPRKTHAPLDLRKGPFRLGQPLFMIPEYSAGKYLGLWDLKVR
jgi:hypothetical protein